MAVVAQFVADAFAQHVLIAMGAVIVGGALAFFLLQMFAWDRGRHAP